MGFGHHTHLKMPFFQPSIAVAAPHRPYQRKMNKLRKLLATLHSLLFLLPSLLGRQKEHLHHSSFSSVNMMLFLYHLGLQCSHYSRMLLLLDNCRAKHCRLVCLSVCPLVWFSSAGDRTPELCTCKANSPRSHNPCLYTAAFLREQ